MWHCAPVGRVAQVARINRRRLSRAGGPEGSVGAAVSLRRYDRHWTPVHLDVVVKDVEAALARMIAAARMLRQRSRPRLGAKSLRSPTRSGMEARFSAGDDGDPRQRVAGRADSARPRGPPCRDHRPHRPGEGDQCRRPFTILSAHRAVHIKKIAFHRVYPVGNNSVPPGCFRR